MNQRFTVAFAGILFALISSGAAARGGAGVTKAAPLEKRWYTADEFLSIVGLREHVQWAMPQTLAGMGFVGGDDVPAQQAVEALCKQSHLSLTKQHDIWVIDRPADEALARWTKALGAGGADAPTAAWELGWRGDARAVTPLVDALSAKDPAIALATAQGLSVLLADVPLGQAQRVDVHPAGRVGLAKAFPPTQDLLPLLSSSYPPIRAAALRVLLSIDSDRESEAAKRSASDKSILVQQVRQQLLYQPPADHASPEPEKFEPLPGSDDATKAACAKLIAELGPLEKDSEWERMKARARQISEWSKRGSEPATDALIELCHCEHQVYWYPAYCQMLLAETGSEKATAHLHSIMPKAGRDTLVRGLERGRCGAELLSFTQPFLNEQAVCYVTTRRAGRGALDDLIACLKQLNTENGDYSLLDALGVIGGPQAAEALTARFAQNEKQSATQIFRSAKALGQTGNAAAMKTLLAATDDPDRMRRHAATLFLGRIGGPDAITELTAILAKDSDRMVKAAAADALEQIGSPQSVAAIDQFRKEDAALPTLAYKPRNPRFGSDFPKNQWVNLNIPILAYDNFGEIGWNYDVADHLFFRYGGCPGYTNELTIFDLGTEQFVQRVPNEEMVGWGERRPPRGCSGGRVWDPIRKVAWIGPSIGGSDADLAIYDYYNKDHGYRFCGYDIATDHFQNSDYREGSYGEPSKRFAFDWRNGLFYTIKSTPLREEKPFWAMDARTAIWQDHSTKGDRPYPRFYGYGVGAVDQESGLLVLYIAPDDREAGGEPHTWVYNPTAHEWKEMHPATQPRGYTGAGLVYDPYRKNLLLQSGKKEEQFGGDADSITWTYDVRTNTWTDLKPPGGPGNAWVGAIDFDAEHDVFVLFNYRNKSVWAFRPN